MAAASARAFHVMAKPAGASCNLACSYCYYLDKAALYPGKGVPRMSDEVLERYVGNLIRSHPPGAEVVFAWQGGEPALLGIDFYRRALAFQRRHGGGRTLVNTFQTNGTLLDDEWCRFLARENFLVGLSLDGPADIHDRCRRLAGGKPSHAAVMRGLDRLQAHGVEFNLLACVNRYSADDPGRVYEFLRATGCRFIQFIPVVERLPGGTGVTEASVGPEAYGSFMVHVFDRWARADVGRLTVMNFEWALANFMGLPGAVCHHQPVCGRSLAVERNGDVYACDHFVAPEYRLGNAAETDLAVLVDSPAQRRFGHAKFAGLPDACRSCDVLPLCWGGCPKHRFVPVADAGPADNHLCAGYAAFFRHALPTLRKMAAAIDPAFRREPVRLCGAGDHDQAEQQESPVERALEQRRIHAPPERAADAEPGERGQRGDGAAREVRRPVVGVRVAEARGQCG